MLRPVRPERGRQDDDAADPHRPAASDLGRSAHSERRRRPGAASGEVARRHRARGRVASVVLDCARVPVLRRAGSETGRPRGANRVLVRILRSRRRRDDALQGPLERDGDEANARRRFHPRAGPRLPRRAVHQPRSHLSTEAEGLPREVRRRRGDRVHGLPPARDRREALQSRRGHPERLDHRDRDRGPDSGRGRGPGVRIPSAGRSLTMSWLLRLMLKEEFRVRASYSGQTMFVSFPFIITMFSLSIAVTSGRLFAYTPLPDAILLLHVSVFLSGLSVGAFGFLGRQYLERTTGTRNYLVAMPGILPMRFRRTFLGMLLRAAIFYMVLLLVPATVGLVLSMPVTHFRLTSIGVLFGMALLSFLLGMSLSFFVSTVYMRTRAGFVVAVAVVSAIFATAGAARAIPFSWILPSLAAHELLPPLGSDLGAAASLALFGLGIVGGLVAGGAILVPERSAT